MSSDSFTAIITVHRKSMVSFNIILAKLKMVWKTVSLNDSLSPFK